MASKSYPLPEIAVNVLRQAGQEAASDRDRAQQSNARAQAILSAVAATAGVPAGANLRLDLDRGVIVAETADAPEAPNETPS